MKTRWLALALAVLMAAPVWADPEPSPAPGKAPICDSAESDNYWTKLSGQFTRGLVNVGFCWLELFHQPLEEYRGPHPNPFRAAGKGLWHTVLRGGRGVVDVLACPSAAKEDGTYFQAADDCAFGILGLEER